MTLYKPSTEKEPLLFFSSFLKKQIIISYETNFYDHPVNPSQIYNKDQGYIEYHKDCYTDEDNPKEKIYFKEYFRKHLETQCSISENFLIERKKVLEYKEVFANGFVKQQLVELNTIIERARSLPHAEIVIEILDDLKIEITKLLYPQTEFKPKRIIKQSSKTTYPFFGNKQGTTISRLKKLYVEVLEIGLIDEEEVTENTFVEVFISPKPFTLERQIKFNKNNYEIMYFFQELSAYFDKLIPVQIGNSKAFASKRGTTITEGMVNTYSSRLKKRVEDSYINIKRAIKKAMPPQN